MKRTLTLIMTVLLIISLLAACGGGKKGAASSDQADALHAENSGSGSAAPDVIHSTALLSIDDAEGILGIKLFDANFTYNKIDEKIPSIFEGVKGLKSDYFSDVYCVSISYYQEVESYVEMMIRQIEKEIENPPETALEYYTAVEGIGDKAYLSRMLDTNIYSINIFSDDHYIIITLTNLTNATAGDAVGEEEIAWIKDKVTECGKLALQHLKEILAGTRSPESNVPVSDSEAAIDEAMNNASSEMIKPSMLITAVEAGSIIGESMHIEGDYDDKIDSGYASSMISAFSSDAYYFLFRIYQDALFQEQEDKIVKDGGIAHYIKERVATFGPFMNDPSVLTPVEGLGDGAYCLKQEGVWVLEFQQGAYWITICCRQTGNVKSTRDKDGELAWQKEKAIEAGKLVSEHLKAIIN